MLITNFRSKKWILIIILAVSLAANFYLYFRQEIDQTASKTIASSYESALSNTQKANDKISKERDQAVEELTAKITELDKTKKEVEKAQADLKKAQDDLKNSLAQIANQKAQIDTNAAELNQLRQRPPLFSFQNNSTNPNVESQKEDIKNIVTAAYDYLVATYSAPYLLHSVSITFVDALDNPLANGQIVINNSQEGLDMEIRMRSFDKNNFADVNTILHEILHSFHGLAALRAVALEEGITVAATDKVMQNLMKDGKIPTFSTQSIQLSEARYNELSADSSFSIPADTNAFYNSPQVYNYYQYEGYTWRKLAGQKRISSSKRKRFIIV